MMNLFKILTYTLIGLLVLSSFAFAAGDAGRGKALFNDPKLGTNNATCNTCHPNGKGLEKASAPGKKEWKTPGGIYKTLEEAVNICITMALKGKPIDSKSQEMMDLVAYIKSLGKKAPAKK